MPRRSASPPSRPALHRMSVLPPGGCGGAHTQSGHGDRNVPQTHAPRPAFPPRSSQMHLTRRRPTPPSPRKETTRLSGHRTQVSFLHPVLEREIPPVTEANASGRTREDRAKSLGGNVQAPVPWARTQWRGWDAAGPCQSPRSRRSLAKAGKGHLPPPRARPAHQQTCRNKGAGGSDCLIKPHAQEGHGLISRGPRGSSLQSPPGDQLTSSGC